MTAQLALNIRLREDATFDNFWGSASGWIQGQERFYYLWGQEGSGKSHLLQAMCHQAHAAGKSSIFLQDLSSHDPELLKSLESFSVICIDDVDAVSGDHGWELALFELYNSVNDGHAQLVVSALKPASNTHFELPDLASRLRAAVAIEVELLNDEDKLSLLQQRASDRGFSLADEVARYILDRAPRDMHHLIELLDILEKETMAHQKLITIPFVKKILQL